LRWYVSRNGETVGPVEEDLVTAWVLNGMWDGFVRNELGGPWIAIGESPFARYRVPAWTQAQNASAVRPRPSLKVAIALAVALAATAILLILWSQNVRKAEKERIRRENVESIRRGKEARLKAEEEYAKQEQERAQLKEFRAKVAKDADAATARLVRAEIERLSKIGPNARSTLLVKCIRDDDCPLGYRSPDLFLAAAGSKSERSRLEATVTQFAKARERAERAEIRAGAPLLCCDGMPSPTCKCGNPKRGCCSHHGGVCGCSAD
jgi:hypothetical protein